MKVLPKEMNPYLICDECDKEVELAIEIGEESYSESNTASICKECLERALRLISDEVKP